jgi:hypothetical protein
MPNPALILVHLGSACAHGGSHEVKAMLNEAAQHAGPVIIIDGWLSDTLADLEPSIDRVLKATDAKGEPALRLWGCDAGEVPYPEWSGYIGSAVNGAPPDGLIYEAQEKAAAALIDLLKDRDLILSGAWATLDDKSGCVNSVGIALEQAGWSGKRVISEYAMLEEDDLE